MAAYRLTPTADADLEEVWRFVSYNSGVNSANRLEDELHQTMGRLAGMPGLGHLRDDLADEALRVYAVHNFLIIYRPDTKPLEVLRIVHGARDLGAALGLGS